MASLPTLRHRSFDSEAFSGWPLNLSKHPEGRKAIFETGGLSLIVHAIKTGSKIDQTQQNVAAILFYLSSVEEYQVEIGENPKGIPTLTELLRDGTYRGKKNALVTLFGLLLYHGNHPKVLAVGAVPVLADLLQTQREDLAIDSAAVLAKIAERQEGTNTILRSAVIPHVVEVLRSTPSRSGRDRDNTTVSSFSRGLYLIEITFPLLQFSAPKLHIFSRVSGSLHRESKPDILMGSLSVTPSTLVF